MFLSEAVTVFLNDCRTAATRSNYEYVTKNLVQALGTLRPLDQILAIDIKIYDQQIAQRWPNPGTLAHHRRVIRTFFNWCVKLELIRQSPARSIKVGRPSRAVAETKAMSDQELRQLLDYAKFDRYLHALILFVADTGCRAGGAATLRWCDINFTDHEAYVTEKGRAPRAVVFGASCAAALITYRDWVKVPAQRAVFATLRCPVPSSAVISKAIARACQKAGLRHMTAHALRHRKGHQLAASHTPPSLAAMILGHADIQMTMEVYYPRDWETAASYARNLTMPDLVDQTSTETKIIPFKRKA